MTMEAEYSARALRAKAFFEQGYNCCQAVLLAFDDMTGLDHETATKLAAGFGGGIGRLREVCGTFTGACMALDLISGSADPNEKESKSQLYARIQEMARQFAQDNGSYICRDLLHLTEKKSSPTPADRTPEYYKKRPCSEMCAYSAQLLENLLLEQK